MRSDVGFSPPARSSTHARGYIDGRSPEERQYDDRDNVTVTHHDFAGRPFIVQNPGGDTAPSSSSPNQSMCLYAEYDDASRLSAIYDGDGGKTVYWRDGPGRMIQRELAVTGANIALWNSKDVIERDVLGRLTRTEIQGGGPPAHALPVVTEWFDQDSLGRTHQEKFRFGWAPSNDVEVNSTWTGGNPFRDGLGYADDLFAGSAPLSMTNAHDEIGRMTGIDWTGHSGAVEELASYGWVGGLRRNRAVKYSSSTWPEGRTYFDYDTYGRLTGIDDRIWTSSTPPSSSASRGNRRDT